MSDNHPLPTTQGQSQQPSPKDAVEPIGDPRLNPIGDPVPNRRVPEPPPIVDTDGDEVIHQFDNPELRQAYENFQTIASDFRRYEDESLWPSDSWSMKERRALKEDIRTLREQFDLLSSSATDSWGEMRQGVEQTMAQISDRMSAFNKPSTS